MLPRKFSSSQNYLHTSRATSFFEDTHDGATQTDDPDLMNSVFDEHDDEMELVDNFRKVKSVSSVPKRNAARYDIRKPATNEGIEFFKSDSFPYESQHNPYTSEDRVDSSRLKAHLDAMEVSFLNNSRIYRRTLTRKMMAIFILVIAVVLVATFVGITLFLRHESQRGILTVFEGRVYITNVTWECENATQRHKHNTELQQQLSLAYASTKTELAFVGTLLEETVCEITHVKNRKLINFLVLFRRMRQRSGLLQPLPGKRDLEIPLEKSNNKLRFDLSTFSVTKL